ncbi:MAG TPA: hypothetical protein VLI69_04560 [Gammaproteobacteria bacterium]|nr:hypothetical protein [Gammaproteobacteria bacterium]
MHQRTISDFFSTKKPLRSSLKQQTTEEKSSKFTQTTQKSVQFTAKRDEPKSESEETSSEEENNSVAETKSASVMPAPSLPLSHEDSYSRMRPFFNSTGTPGMFIEEGQTKTETIGNETRTLTIEKQTYLTPFQREEREISTYIQRIGLIEQITRKCVERVQDNGMPAQINERTSKVTRNL